MSRIQVVIGRCPVCDGRTESADGLENIMCGRGHEPVQYVPADAYYEEASETWKE
jgi:hypothetical protein